MSITDPTADMLTIMRNAIRAKKENVDLPASKLGKAILEILKREGYIDNFKFLEDKKQGRFRVYLGFDPDKKPLITDLRRISKPSLRVYVNSQRIPYVLRGKGMALLSTSKGVLTDKEARQMKVGGEVLCYVW